MFKRGDNIRFICTYLFNNPGSTYTQVRDALCVFRGHDPKKRRGQYTWYFSRPSWRGTPRKIVRWEKRDRRYYLTSEGLAWVSQA